MGVKFHRLWLRYHRALFVGAVCTSAFYLGRATVAFNWSNVIAMLLYIANACVFFIPLWREEKKHKQEFLSMMRSVEAEMQRRGRTGNTDETP